VSRVTGSVAGFQPVQFVAAALILTGLASPSQIRDATQPPPIVHSAGQFRARPLNQRPAIDGRAWIVAGVRPTYSAGVVATRRTFSLTSSDCGDRGDFTRCRLLFHRDGGAPVRIDAGFTGWVFVTPDGRYVITEPLYALDVREWKQYALFDALKIPNYVTIEAISGDATRLLLSRRDCAMDCKEVPVEYYELILP
jgi:hypothetical protein